MSKRRSQSAVTVSGAWKPRLVFWLLAAAVMLLGGRELFNMLQRPSLTKLSGPAQAASFVLYQKGRPAEREAWLFVEPDGDRGPPRCFQFVDCSEKDTATGDLQWTFDGAALYAVKRKPEQTAGPARPLWLYEFTTGKLWSAQAEALRSVVPVQLVSEQSLMEMVQRHGGAGPVAVQWYDMGKRGAYLFAWEITRWEQALPES